MSAPTADAPTFAVVTLPAHVLRLLALADDPGTAPAVRADARDQVVTYLSAAVAP